MEPKTWHKCWHVFYHLSYITGVRQHLKLKSFAAEERGKVNLENIWIWDVDGDTLGTPTLSRVSELQVLLNNMED